MFDNNTEAANRRMMRAMSQYADWCHCLMFAYESPTRFNTERQQAAHFVCCHLEAMGFEAEKVVPEKLMKDANTFRNQASGRAA